ncbi:helix-turn-helix domain-containing protein [Micromonospora zhanjiangensis]
MPASASQDPRVLAFARFVKRALGEARAEGWSIDDVEERTGLRRSTIYRWTRAEVESPQRIQVHKFVDGLGIPRTTASQILGWDGTPPATDPDVAVDPDMQAVMRRLKDPSVTPEEKTTIRQMLRYLARGG